MSTITLTRGIPGSGKTDAALRWVAESPETRMRLSRDDDRLAKFGRLHGLTEQQEALITRFHMDAARVALAKGIDVIVDATHLTNWQIKPWFKVGPVEFWDFPISIEDAIARDAAREKSVGEAVIRKFAKRVNKDGSLKLRPTPPTTPEYAPYVPNKDWPIAWVFDIDGTLARIPAGGRSPYDYSRVSEDEPIEHVCRMVDSAVELGIRVVFLSGREDSCYADTAAWIERNTAIRNPRLHMRPTGDKRDDAIVKYELFTEHIATHFNVEAIFDDRLRVARMWHAIGAPLFKVGDPDSSF